jgi:small-conductance mechanosensitive channel
MEDFSFFGEDSFISQSTYIQIGFTVLLLILFLVVRKITRRFILKHAERHKMDDTRVIYIRKLAYFAVVIIFLILLSLVWQVSIAGLSVYFASFFTIAGIAFFAQWSILSNITASIVLFLYFPFRFGSRIKIMDGDNSVIGRVVDISIFAIEIEQDNGEHVTYPNNLALQKSIIELHGSHPVENVPEDKKPL